MSIKQRLKDWYQGEYIPAPRNDPDSPIVFISVGYYEQSLLAKLLKLVGQFWLAHWQWIIATAIGVVGIIVAL